MSYQVGFIQSAEADLEERLTALAERSPDAAERLNDCLEQALLRLRAFPFSCGPSYENPRFAEEVRHLLRGVREIHPGI